jgi:hypothetical protein
MSIPKNGIAASFELAKFVSQWSKDPSTRAAIGTPHDEPDVGRGGAAEGHRRTAVTP